MKYPGLARRDGGVWYVRKRVPDDLRRILGSSDIRRSLKTTDRRDAEGRYHSEMAEIAESFKQCRAELATRETIERGLSTGRIDLLGRAEVEKLVAEWWDGREAVRKPQLDEFTDRRNLLAAIREEAAMLAERPEGDAAMRLADQLLVKAGAAADARRVGTMLTASPDPAVDRTNEQYRYLCELVGRALRLESVMAVDHLLGRRDAVHEINDAPVVALGPKDLKYEVTGRLSVTLQWGSGSDLSRDMGATSSESFPFTIAMTAPVDAPHDFQHAATYSIDMTGWYGEDYELAEVAEEGFG